MKRYIIFNSLCARMPDVAQIIKEGPKTYSVGHHDIAGLHRGTMSSRVDKDKVIAILTDEGAVVRAMYFFGMMHKQHRDVVKAADKAWEHSREQLCELLKAHQKREEKGE